MYSRLKNTIKKMLENLPIALGAFLILFIAVIA